MISSKPMVVVAVLALAGTAGAQDKPDEQIAERANAALRQVRDGRHG